MSASTPKVARKRIARLGITMAMLILCAGASLWFWCSRSPDGVYYDKYLSPTTYWRLKAGKIALTARNSDWVTSERVIDTGGIYTNSVRGWVMRGKDGQPDVVVKPGLFGIRLVCPEMPGPAWNRFLPRRGFVWMESWGLQAGS